MPAPIRSVVLFVAIVLVLGWLRLVPQLIEIITGTAVGSAVQNAVLLLGSFAPLWAALIVTTRWLGGPGVGVVLRQLRRWRVGGGWYGAAVVGPVLVAVAALAIAVALGVPAPSFGMTALVDAATIFVLAAVFGAGLARVSPGRTPAASACPDGGVDGRRRCRPVAHVPVLHP